MIFKKRFLFGTILLLAILTACSGTSADEKIYNHLEEAVLLEEDFEQQQAKIIDLEKKEQAIYDQIIGLEEKDLEEIKQLSEEAIDIIEERLDKVKVEEESIQASKDEFVKIKDLIEKLSDEQVIEKANEMYSTMLDRYEIYEDLNKEYINTLILEEELYTLLPGEETEQEDVSDQVEKVNEKYQRVLELNEQFNKKTTEYNTVKKEFYNIADLNVEYKGE